MGKKKKKKKAGRRFYEMNEGLFKSVSEGMNHKLVSSWFYFLSG